MKKISFFGIVVLIILSAVTLVFYQSCSKDKCGKIKCENGGTCAGGFCNCATGYEGTDCSTEQRTKFLATYIPASIDACTSASPGPLVITAGSAVSEIVLTHFCQLTVGGNPVYVTATLSGFNAFTIPSQTIGNYIFSGGGSLITGTTNTLTISYNYHDNVSGNDYTSCGATYN